jgi:hypothetical protein
METVEMIRVTTGADLAAIALTQQDMMVVVDRATAIVNGTMPMPTTPRDKQSFWISSRVEITNLTLDSGGKTVYENISYLPANKPAGWFYNLEADAWFPHISRYTGYALSVQALTSSPADGQTIFFGMLPKAPVTTGGQSKVFIRKPGLIKAAEIYCFSGTAGTAEAWNMFLRLNNTTDTQIAQVAAATQERIFNNGALNIDVVSGDYFEIKCVNPTWATNPLTTIFGGYIYIE